MISKVYIFSKSFLLVKGLRTFLKENYRVDSIILSKNSSLNLEKKSLLILDNMDELSDDIINEKELEILLFSHIAEFKDGTINIFSKKDQLLQLFDSYLTPSNKSQKFSETNLTKRETEVLREISLGHSNQEIAEKLFISKHTVISHRKNITEKLGIKTIPGLTVYAILNNLIDTKNLNNTQLI